MFYFSLVKQRFFLLIVLTGIILYSFTGELVAYGGGAGWDGMTYYSIVKDFDVLIKSHGIDSYHMTRILPFAIITIFCQSSILKSQCSLLLFVQNC